MAYPVLFSKNHQGIALFLVLGSIAFLSILITEFTYFAHMSQSIAYNQLDQMKALYLAKSALKISLLRLKVYQKTHEIKQIPIGISEKIWNFPLIYPIPSIGLTLTEQELLKKFQKESQLEGTFTANIESESSKFPINRILSHPTLNGKAETWNPETSRKSLKEFLEQIYQKKLESDPDFAIQYRDFRIDDLVDQMITWADRTYEYRTTSRQEQITIKRAPFYDLSELHQLPALDDTLYDLFTPHLTTSLTKGININTMNADVAQAVIPMMTLQEANDFLKYRDSTEEDHQFRTPEDFFQYLKTAIHVFYQNPESFKEFQESLGKNSIQLITLETEFKITIRAQVGQATQTLQVWVTLDEKLPSSSSLSNLKIIRMKWL